MTKKANVIVFDLDDTLYKEIDFVRSGFRHVAQILSEEIPSADSNDIFDVLWQARIQGDDAYDAVIRKFQLGLHLKEMMKEHYRFHHPDISLEEDTRNLLIRLKAAGAVLGIISDGRQIQQTNKITALGLREFVDDKNIIINSDKERYKPDPHSFRNIMARYGDSYYWYIGDNPTKDFKAPNELGWTTVCLLDDGRNCHPQAFDLATTYLPAIKIENLLEVWNLCEKH